MADSTVALSGWWAEYDFLPPLKYVLKKLAVVERTNGLSTATHTFVLSTATAGDFSFDKLLQSFIELGASPFSFRIVNARSGSRSWKHRVLDLDFQYSPNGTSVSRLVVTTVEEMAVMNAGDKSRSFTEHFGLVSELVRTLIRENGLTVGTIQDTTWIGDLLIVRQPYITDYELITNYLLPRAVSDSGADYRMFTDKDGAVCFQTLGHEAKDVTLNPLLIDLVKESSTGYALMKAGGAGLFGSTVNPLTKEIESAGSSGSDEEREPDSIGPPWPHAVHLHHPTYTKDALSAIMSRRQRNLAGTAYPLIFRQCGSATLDNDGTLPSFPMRLTLKEGTAYRSVDGHTGLLSEIFHSLSGGSYTIQMTCDRPAAKS